MVASRSIGVPDTSESLRTLNIVHGVINQRATEDTGRNDKCPCGSGLKFKRCCLALCERR